MDRFRDNVEEQIQEAMERGEFDHLPGTGRRLDLGEDSPNWWARRKVEELKRQNLIIEEVRTLEAERDRLWTLPDPDTVMEATTSLNRRIEELNRRLRPDESLPPLDPDETMTMWRRMARLRPS